MAWHGPTRQQTSLEAFQQLKNAGFSINFSNYGERDFNLQALDWAAQAGIQLLLADPRLDYLVQNRFAPLHRLDSLVLDYQKHPAFFGYYLKDEPSQYEFERLAEVAKYLRQKDPIHPSYINLFPTYASPLQLGADSYFAYVQNFLDQVQPHFLSFDHYPILEKGLRPDFYQNLEIIRRAALGKRIPFWAFTLSVPHSPYPTPHITHLRLQLYSALAYGARGLQYFTYSTPISNQWNFRDAILGLDGRLTSTYEATKRVNEEILRIAPLISQMQSEAVCHSQPIPTGCIGLQPHLPIVSVYGSDILMGFFRDKNGHYYVLLVNKNYNTGAMPKIYFSQKVRRLLEIPRNNSQAISVNWRKSHTERNHPILFKAGEGRLFLLELESE